jgi:hypothetical protein
MDRNSLIAQLALDIICSAVPLRCYVAPCYASAESIRAEPG